MEIGRLLSVILLTTAAASAFSLSNQEMVSLLNQPVKQQPAHRYQKHNGNPLHWQSLQGPQIGRSIQIVPMKNNPSLLFAFRPYSTGAIYKSVDGGQSWKSVSKPNNIFIFDLISVDNNRLLLSADSSIYVSDDLGENWILSANINKYGYELFALNPDLILLKTDIRSSSPSLYRSLNQGKTWTPARLGLNMEYPPAAMGGRDHLLLVSTHGLHISTNQGKLWTQPEQWKNYRATSLALSSNHDIFFVNGTRSLYKTDPQGESVEVMNHTIPGFLDEIHIDNRDNLYILSHDYEPNRSCLYQSIDKGHSWKRLHESDNIYHLTTLEDGKVIISTNDSLLQYEESLDNFIKLPLTFSVSRTSKVSALDTDHLFAIDEASIYSSHDSGKTWNISRSNKVIDMGILNKTLLATEWKNGNETNLLASDDNGLTWQAITAPDKLCQYLSSQLDALIISCQNRQYLTRDLLHWKMLKNYGSHYVFGHTIYSSNNQSIKYSDNDGQTWKTLLDNLNDYGTKITGYQDKVVLVALYDIAIIKTTDGGNTWELINNGIEDYHFSGITAISENHYMVTTQSGVYTTTDGGNHWFSDNNGLDNIEINSLFANQDLLLVGTGGSGVFKAALPK